MARLTPAVRPKSSALTINWRKQNVRLGEFSSRGGRDAYAAPSKSAGAGLTAREVSSILTEDDAHRAVSVPVAICGAGG